MTMNSAVLERLIEDDAVHEHLTEAAAHLRAAATRVTRPAKPSKPHRARAVALALAAGAGAAVAVQRAQRRTA
jgi:hypothetical protein